MQGHIHLSVISVATIAAVVLLTTFAMHLAGLHLNASQNENTRAWGKAVVIGWG